MARIQSKVRKNNENLYVGIDTNNVKTGEALNVWESDRTNKWLDQFWVFDENVYKEKYGYDKHLNKTLSPFAHADLCVENGDGGFHAVDNGDKLRLSSCNATDREDQQWVLTDGFFYPGRWGNIYIHGLGVCRT